MVLEHCLFQLGFHQMLLEPSVPLPQLGQPYGLLGLHPPVLLPSAVLGRLRHLDESPNYRYTFVLNVQLLGALELVDDLLRCVPVAFHGEVSGPVWPYVDSLSSRTELGGPRHTHPSSAL